MKENYFNRTEVSNSDMKMLKKSFMHYLHEKIISAEDRLETPAMLFGTAMHCLILEPQKFKKQFVFAPKCDKRTKIGKEIFNKFQAENEGKTMLKEEFFEALTDMRDAIRYHPTANDVLSLDGNVEVEKELTFEFQGVPCRMKADLINHDKHCIVDLKTIAAADSLDRVGRQILSYEYYRQAAFYSLGAEINYKAPYNFIFVFIETAEPYGIRVVEIDEDYILYGIVEIERILDNYRLHIENPKMYHGYHPDLQIVNKPKFL